MNDIIPYTFPETNQPVRTVTIDGEPWFVAADVADILGYRMASDLTRRLDDDEKGTRPVRTPGGTQNLAVVNEPGLYTAILGSRIPQAKAFRRWVTHDVLPSIRRTGQYTVAPREMTKLEALQAAIESERARLVAEERVRELEPAAAAWDRLASAAGDFSLRDAAHILSRDPAISTGQNRLMQSLRELRMVDGKGTPYARHVQARHLVERARAYEHPHTGESVLGRAQVRVTAAGLRYLHTKLGGVAPLRFDQLPFDNAA